jgi:hypothetical protein
MKSSMQLDHIATCNEVWDALAFSPRDAYELDRARDAQSEVEPGFGDGVGILAETRAWLALANEALDIWLN